MYLNFFHEFEKCPCIKNTEKDIKIGKLMQEKKASQNFPKPGERFQKPPKTSHWLTPRTYACAAKWDDQ